MTNCFKNMHIHDVAYNNIQQAIQMISHLPDDVYTRTSVVMPYSTIGKHVRHSYDHFIQLIKQAKGEHWTIDFDARARNTPMEVDRAQAIQQLKQLQQSLFEIRDIPLEYPVTLSASIDPNDPTHYPFVSSFGRELWYCCIHAIHHFASIKAICIEAGHTLPAEFGVAPSTIQDHRKHLS
ncbi:uncharacterized protein BX664DRAFT_322272 [Halteromyces radiatus]|uniref:uncharacterized protein n=1 Tax=Halteromyces radiatus TaxID=101107 RepID=UPI00221E3966|nr:uncharacterized protein BX664DRAFT_322272 [Halteromyces radiatus]KAI8099859.1 hypothetical protein BX664DRAFT_322272 [Halteromyces radiatus]